MTTIAYRDGVMAADTSMTVDGLVLPGRVKIGRREDGALVGACGKSGFSDAFRQWAIREEGEPPKPVGSTGVIVMPDGLVRVWDDDEGDTGFSLRPPYYAMGSGAAAALGAMFAGANAEAAVRAAIAHDRSTNGDVTVCVCGVRP